MAELNKLVAVVTGASRGIGRGIALELGELGATVYVVGRSTAAAGGASPGGVALPGSIEATAEEVTAAGGKGIPLACDLADDDAIRALFEQVEQESGRLDILVNNAAYLHEDMGTVPFWNAPPSLANIIDVGLRCHHLAAYFGAPLLIRNGRGLIVNISFFRNAGHDPAYYAAKAGLDALASAYTGHFGPYGVAAVSLWPGYVQTERADMTDKDLMAQLAAMSLESVRYCGRVIAAMWADPDMMALNGKTLIAAEMGERYGISDLPGFEPKSLRDRWGGPHAAFDLARS